MVIARTSLRANGVFVDLGVPDIVIHDPDYVEGAIELTVDGVRLIESNMWDYVDQLWAYIVTGLEAICCQSPFETYFPDQPILFRFDPMPPGRVRITVRVGSAQERNAIAGHKEFLRAMLSEATRVFVRLAELLPANNASYAEVLEKLRRLSAAEGSTWDQV